MDFYIISALSELGILRKLSTSFPTSEQMAFIESIAEQENTQKALNLCFEETKSFEKDGLENLVTAHQFFKKLRHVSQRGSYKTASIRMDVQFSTRMMKNAPDCKFNMVLKTKEWEKTLNMSPATADKLLCQLLEARTMIRQSKESAHVEVE